MTSPSAVALTGFIAWTLLLVLLMEVLRSQLVLRGKVAANSFSPDNAGLSPFLQRLARAHSNCVEGLPVFGGLLLVALATGRTPVTDSLAYLLLGSRMLQSLVHLASAGAPAATARFAAFSVQLVIACYWACSLLLSFTA